MWALPRRERAVAQEHRLPSPCRGPGARRGDPVAHVRAAHHRPEADLALAKTICQGFDMGRPSILEAAAEKKAGTVTATYIGGRCVPMMKGTIDLT
jgi:trans-2,3-dihydro-3-hydroxyanthranilate isomerase